MMFGLASCKRPKLSVLLDSFMGRYVNTSAAGHVFDRFEDMEPYIKDILLKYLEKSKIHEKTVDDRTMYPPGKIIFLRPYGGLEQSKHVAWDAVWIQARGTCMNNRKSRSLNLVFMECMSYTADLMDEGLLLSKAMFGHHHIQNTLGALQIALETSEKKKTSHDTNTENSEIV